jgi:hypothetical protein
MLKSSWEISNEKTENMIYFLLLGKGISKRSHCHVEHIVYHCWLDS